MTKLVLATLLLAVLSGCNMAAVGAGLGGYNPRPTTTCSFLGNTMYCN
jgi:hypothetical protein